MIMIFVYLKVAFSLMVIREIVVIIIIMMKIIIIIIIIFFPYCRQGVAYLESMASSVREMP